MPTATMRIRGDGMPGLRWGKYSNVHLGVQQRKDVIDLVAGDAATAAFDIPIEVVLDPQLGIDYRGPFAQGKRGQRFVYLSWGERVGTNGFAMFRRAKLNLFNLPHDIAQALADGATVEGVLRLTDQHGAPICASILPDHIVWTIVTSDD